VSVGAPAELPGLRQQRDSIDPRRRDFFLRYTWGTAEPTGSYTFFLALTTVGALADGQLGPS
jgi:hypothetical protein